MFELETVSIEDLELLLPPPPPTTINDLDDKCLEFVFLHLDVRNLIKIERICKRWRNLSLANWTLRDCNARNIWRNCLRHRDPASLVLHVIKSILTRCGKYRTRELICLQCYEHTGDEVGLVGMLCPNLRELAISQTRVSGFSLMSLARLSYLEILRMYGIPNDFDQLLAGTLGCVKNLVEFSIADSLSFTGKSLASVTNERFIYLNITNCPNFNPDYLKYSLTLTRCLRNLTLITDASLPNVDALAFTLNLIRLRLQTSNLSDDVLLGIVANCRLLTHLAIYVTRFLTNASVERLLELPYLQCLDMQNVAGRVRWSQRCQLVPDLTYLELENDNLSIADLLRIVELSPKLATLKLTVCDMPPEQYFWHLVYDRVQARNNGVNLVIDLLQLENGLLMQRFLTFEQKFFLPPPQQFFPFQQYS